MIISRFMTPLKNLLLQEALQVEGFMQLLMKRRNGVRWSKEERQALARHLNAMARVVPALLIFSLPGGMIFLPILAWFIDRRKGKTRTSDPAASASRASQP